MNKYKMMWEIDKMISELKPNIYDRQDLLKQITTWTGRGGQKFKGIHSVGDLINFSETSVHITYNKVKNIYKGEITEPFYEADFYNYSF